MSPCRSVRTFLFRKRRFGEIVTLPTVVGCDSAPDRASRVATPLFVRVSCLYAVRKSDRHCAALAQFIAFPAWPPRPRSLLYLLQCDRLDGESGIPPSTGAPPRPGAMRRFLGALYRHGASSTENAADPIAAATTIETF